MIDEISYVNSIYSVESDCCFIDTLTSPLFVFVITLSNILVKILYNLEASAYNVLGEVSSTSNF